MRARTNNEQVLISYDIEEPQKKILHIHFEQKRIIRVLLTSNERRKKKPHRNNLRQEMIQCTDFFSLVAGSVIGRAGKRLTSLSTHIPIVPHPRELGA